MFDRFRNAMRTSEPQMAPPSPVNQAIGKGVDHVVELVLGRRNTADAVSESERRVVESQADYENQKALGKTGTVRARGTCIMLGAASAVIIVTKVLGRGM